MPFRVTCPGCRTACVIPDEALGQNVRCKQCSRVFQVSGAKPSSPAAPPVAPPSKASSTESSWWQAGQANAPSRPAAKVPPPAPKKPSRKEAAPLLEPVEEVAERLEEVAELEPLEEAPEDGLQTRPSPRPTAKKKVPPAKKLARSPRREVEVPRRSSGLFWAIGIAAAVLLIGGGVGLAFLLSGKEEEETKTVQTAAVEDSNKDNQNGAPKPPLKKSDNRKPDQPGDKVAVEKPEVKKPEVKIPRGEIAPPPPPVDVKLPKPADPPAKEPVTKPADPPAKEPVTRPADPPAKEPVTKPADPAPPTSVGTGGIKPPTLKEDKQEVKLPSAISALAVGGGGRYLILHLAQQRKLAIFDANEAKIVKYLPAAADNVKFAAGMDKLFVALPDNNILQRWSLSRLERELTTQIPGAGQVHHLAMGSASHGPLLLARGEQFRVATSFLDIKTLKPLNVRSDRGDVPGVSADTFLRVSADGRVFGMWNPNLSPQGVQTWVLTGEKLAVHGNGDSSGHVVPGPDGKIVYTGRGMYTSQAKRIGNTGPRGGVYFLPALEGRFALSVTPPNVNLHFAGETRSLVTLKDIELPKEVSQWGREPFGTDHRFLLIPAAKLLITVPETNDRLVLHRCDVFEALEMSGIDYLLVMSRPPEAAERGSAFAYKLEVKSKKGGVKYKLDSAPKGMAVSPAGRVTWKVPADFAEAETDVILSISDASGQEVFQTFKLAIVARSTLPVVKDAPAKEPPIKEPPVKEPPKDPPAKEPEPKPMDPTPETPSESGVYGIKPPTLERAMVERKLPSTVSSVVVGGGGRYLILHLPSEQKLAIFDANEGKVTRYIPATDDNVLFAAGLDKLMVVLPGTHLIQRWSLSTGKREVTAKFPVKGVVRRLCMGSASHGPLLVGGEDGRSAGAVFLDIRTLKPLRYQLVGQGDFGFDANTFIRVSANGRVFGKWQPNVSPQGITTLVLTGATARVYSGHISVGHVVPGPDGKTIFTGRGTYTNQVKAIGKSGTREGVYSLPAAHGDDFFMSLNIIGTFGGKTKSTLSVHLKGDQRPFATLDDVELPDNLNQWDRDAISSDMRLHLIPAAKLIVTLAPTNDKLVLHRFDPETALQKSGLDYLIVTSRPPTTVRRGAKLNYKITAKSPKGGFKYKIESGPKGMTVSPEGQVMWKVPLNQTLGNTEVIITVSDSGGQERFHSFTLSVRR